MFKVIKYKFLSVILMTGFFANAQETFIHNDPFQDYKQAKDLFNKEAYSLAYPMFKALEFKPDSIHHTALIKTEIEYYKIVCGLKLNDEAAATNAKRFIENNIITNRVQLMAFHLAEFYFVNQQYNEALNFYEQADVAALTNREVADLKFHQAYSYFSLQQFKQAKPLFNAIRQISGDPNYSDANYYYGFIAFYDKQYDQALSSFMVIEKEPAYSNIVPYYLTQIYYFTGQKDKAIDYGKEILKREKQYYDNELRQLIGHAYFEKRNYTEALPYLESYVQNTDKVRREDLYELAYCYYQTNQIEKAIKGFKELGGKEDSLAQNSMYLLADSYLKTGEKANARNAFLFSATNSSNAIQKEISQFNYAKLSYELGYNDIALQELQNFIVSYPKSDYQGEAKDLLVQVMTTGNNYKDGLALYRTLSSKSEGVKKIFPKLVFGRAVELINDQQINEADILINEFLAAPYNQFLLPYANFWKGELMYRKNNFDSSVYFLNRYLQQPLTNDEVNTVHAKYTLGYDYLRLENYALAYQFFTDVSPKITESSEPLLQDAFLRRGDALFMQKNYAKALPIYNYFVDNKLPNADYALYQKALIAGAHGKPQEKILLLSSLIQNYPSSGLRTDALMETGNTNMALENYADAITAFEQVARQQEGNHLKTTAMLNAGVAYFNLSKNEKALEIFKSLVKNHPNSDESNAAIEYVRSIYLDQQKPDAFIDFMKQNNKAISFNEEDSLMFTSADMRFQNNDAGNAVNGFTQYLKQYPGGRYTIEASYKLGLLLNNKKDYNNAVLYFSKVADMAPNKYAEQAALQSARIYYFELKDYSLAEKYFQQLKSIAGNSENKLEAMRGLLRCQYKLQQFGDAVENAKHLLNEKGIATDDKMMAGMVIAKNHQINNQYNDALASYRNVIALGRSEFSAEARFRVSEILFAQAKLTQAEKAAFEAINKSGSYDYWITKSYILLGEIYFAQKDYFNAEATLKSVTENASIPELAQEAKNKLSIVIHEKNKSSKVQQ